MNTYLRHSGMRLGTKSQIVRVSVVQLGVLLPGELGLIQQNQWRENTFWERKAASIFS